MTSRKEYRVAVVVLARDGLEPDWKARIVEWRSQRGVAVEVIVVDGTVCGEVRAAGALNLREEDPSVGLAYTRALRATDAPWIAWSDPKTRDHPERFLRQIEALTESGADLATCDLGLEENGTVQRQLAVELGGERPPGPWQAGVLVRREALAEIDRRTFAPAELGLLHALRSAGRVQHVAEALVFADADTTEGSESRTRADADLLRAWRDEHEAPPEMSVLLRSRGNDEALAGSLEALARQPLPLGIFEILVIHDDSDGTARELSSRFKPAVPCRFFSRRSGGKSDALARSVGAARGRSLLLMDGDVSPLPDTVRRHLEVHRAPHGERRVVLGTIELPQERLDIALNRYHEATRRANTEFEFQTRHFSASRAVLSEHLGEELPDRDLEARLVADGLEIVQHSECHSVCRRVPDFDEMRGRVRAIARDSARFYRDHLGLLARSQLRPVTREELVEERERTSPVEAKLEAAGKTLSQVDLGTLERAGGRFGVVAACLSDSLGELLPKLEQAWRDHGRLDGLDDLQVDSYEDLLEPWRLDLSGLPGKKLLLHADPFTSPSWNTIVELWLYGVGSENGESRDGSSLVVWADERFGIDERDVRAALSPILRRAKAHSCWAPVGVLATKEDVVDARIMASVDGLLHIGTLLDADDVACAEETGTPIMDPVSHLLEGEHAPWPLATAAPIRLLAWPCWEHEEELSAFMSAIEPILERDDVCIVGLVDPRMEDARPALSAIEAEFARGSWKSSLELLLEVSPDSASERHRLAYSMDGVLLPPSTPSGRAALLESVRLPHLRAASDVRTLLAQIDGARDELVVLRPEELSHV